MAVGQAAYEIPALPGVRRVRFLPTPPTGGVGIGSYSPFYPREGRGGFEPTQLRSSRLESNFLPAPRVLPEVEEEGLIPALPNVGEDRLLPHPRME